MTSGTAVSRAPIGFRDVKGETLKDSRFKEICTARNSIISSPRKESLTWKDVESKVGEEFLDFDEVTQEGRVFVDDVRLAKVSEEARAYVKQRIKEGK